MPNSNDLEKAQKQWLEFMKQHPETIRRMVEQSLMLWENVRDTVEKKPDLQEIQATCLKRLEDANNQTQAALSAIASHAATTALTLQQITSAIGSIQRLESYCQSFEPVAQYLKQAGLPQVSETIEQLAADLRGGEKLYKDMWGEAVNEQRKRGLISQGVNDQWLSTMQGVLERQQAAFQAQQKRWTADFSRSCVHCGQPLGDQYYNLAICPKCGLFLH
jgi:hypothetical protein